MSKRKLMLRFATLAAVAVSLSQLGRAATKVECSSWVCWCDSAVEVCNGDGDCDWVCTRKVCEVFSVC
jgi:hypothetical protein